VLSKNSSKHTVKKKDILISTVMVMRHLSLYAEDKYDITKDIIKALNDKYKAAAKTEEK
jgi:Skp family chaperone for outer membrane proteins